MGWYLSINLADKSDAVVHQKENTGSWIKK